MTTAATAAIGDAKAQFESFFTPETIATLTELGITWGTKIIGALVVFIVGVMIAGRLRTMVTHVVERSPSLDETLANFFGSMVYWLIFAFVVIAVLSMFGIQTTGLAALIGAAGLAIGLALQGTLSHVASGVLLLTFRPFKIGDYVDAGGKAGTVKGIGLFTTELATVTNVKIVVPNGDIYSGPIENFSAHSTRRVDMTMNIAYDENINDAMAIIRKEYEGDARVLKDPEPFIGVINLGASSVDIVVRLWVQSSDYWPVMFDLKKQFKEALDAGGISIPFQTQTLYVENVAK